MRALTVIALAVASLAVASGARLPGAASCSVFPATNPWNQRVDRLAVVARSAEIVGSIGAGSTLHADFGSGLWEGSPIGIPITVVPGSQKRVRVSFLYAGESDHGPYPIPRNVRIEGGSDRHAVIVDRDACRLYELYALERAGSRWKAGSGATWDLRSNRLRPAGWTSADAAGLPILPGLARYDEVAAGRIDHALRFTVSRRGARMSIPRAHYASDETDPYAAADGPAPPPEGRLSDLRLPAAGTDRCSWH